MAERECRTRAYQGSAAGSAAPVAVYGTTALATSKAAMGAAVFQTAAGVGGGSSGTSAASSSRAVSAAVTPVSGSAKRMGNLKNKPEVPFVVGKERGKRDANTLVLSHAGSVTAGTP